MYSEDQAGDAARNSAEAHMPPVTSQPFTGASSSRDTRMAPPFAGRPTRAAAATEEQATAQQQIEPEPLFAEQPVQAQPEAAGQTSADTTSIDQLFAMDLTLSETALAALDDMQPQEEEVFALEAFIIPEDTSRVPSGVAGLGASEEPPHTPVTTLAEKLEKLSHRLRVEDADAVLGRLAAGDKLDAMLAGLLAGYLAGSK